jgi:hypothetical protein
MMRRLLTVAVLVLTASAPSLAERLPRILIVGDSGAASADATE